MRYIVMVLVMILACLNLSAAQAVTTPDQRESLQGLPGISVLIETISPDAQADGLTEEAIRTAVELILRSSGIRILTLSERVSTPSAPYLYVTVNTYKSKTGPAYAVSVRVALIQRVSLVHRPEHQMSAETYEIGSVGIFGIQMLRSLTSVAVEPLIKQFANDFLAVNPP